MTRRLPRAGLLLLVLTPALYGCASMQQDQASDTEQLLAAAGFKARPADTPQKLAHLETLQPFKLIARSKGDQFVYTYADPKYCRCLYAGGPKAYQELQRLKLERQQAAQEYMAEASAMDWSLWGPVWW
ncbi:MAG TPA: hypothetical protein VMS64_20860 [Candidatus Methylomirabilis sp.]|nr:hypothetical protein [Candidatus Methylomirabilis sp.]